MEVKELKSNRTNQNIKTFNKYLYFSAFTANLSTFTLGVVYAWSSPALPRLNGSIDPESNPLSTPITPSQESLIASLTPLGCLVSACAAGLLCDRIGRKRTLLISAAPQIVGFLLCSFATNVYFFYFGRVISGFGCGIVFTVIPIYVGEISEKHNRGILSCAFTFNINLGNLLVYLLAPYCTITTLSMISLAVPVLFVVTFGCFACESPYYHVMKNEIEKARISLLKLRHDSEEMVEDELLIIRKSVKESTSKKRVIEDRALKRGLTISLSLACLQQLSGINIIFFYMQSIFEESKTALSSDFCTIIVGIVQWSASMIASFTIDKFGRRFLLLISSIGMVITLLVLSIYFCMKEASVDVQNFNSLPIIFINLFVLTYSLGFAPVIFGITGELFPIHSKSLASTLTICSNLTTTFIMTTTFPYLKDSIGMGFTFVMLAAFSFAGGCFTFFRVPETKGKTLLEVEEMLRK